jgi:hypothetical protein
MRPTLARFSPLSLLSQTLAKQLEHMQGEYNRIEDIKFDVAAKLDEKFLQKQMVRRRVSLVSAIPGLRVVLLSTPCVTILA